MKPMQISFLNKEDASKLIFSEFKNQDLTSKIITEYKIEYKPIVNGGITHHYNILNLVYIPSEVVFASTEAKEEVLKNAISVEDLLTKIHDHLKYYQIPQELKEDDPIKTMKLNIKLFDDIDDLEHPFLLKVKELNEFIQESKAQIEFKIQELKDEHSSNYSKSINFSCDEFNNLKASVVGTILTLTSDKVLETEIYEEAEYVLIEGFYIHKDFITNELLEKYEFTVNSHGFIQHGLIINDHNKIPFPFKLVFVNNAYMFIEITDEL